MDFQEKSYRNAVSAPTSVVQLAEKSTWEWGKNDGEKIKEWQSERFPMLDPV